MIGKGKLLINYIFIILCVQIILLILASEAISGGLNIHTDDLLLNGYLPTSSFNINQKIIMSYTADDYSYSGGSREYEYFVFFITKSSMKKGTHRRDEQIFLQLARRYSEHDEIRPIRYRVSFNAPSEKGIYEIKYCRFPFFTNYAIGRIDHDRTIYRNRIEPEIEYLDERIERLMKLRRNSQEREEWIVYEIEELTKRQEEIKREYGLENDLILSPNDYSDIRTHIKSQCDPTVLCKLTVLDNNKLTRPDVVIYLEVNGSIPGVKPIIKTGVSEKLTYFSWYIEESLKISNIFFRYKLYPDDDEWSPWTMSKETEYFYISSGQHEFRVEGKYNDENGKEKITPQVSYSFMLSKPFIARPIIKGESRKVKDKENVLMPDKLYSNSMALLIGITNFQDGSFAQIPYIENDVTTLETVLKKIGFDVKSLKGKITREDIFNSIEELINSAKENDRLIIYFSSHGFPDSTISSEGYIASFDCIKDKPSANCISLTELDKIVERGISKPVKHILIIVDSCFSGLGVLTKNTKYPDIAKIATKKGAHMMTAGIVEQNAQVDLNLKMSIFTHFLANGLSKTEKVKNADYTNDGIITLTELLLYVQYEVAQKTNATQIPMLGRIHGDGEMIFDLR